MVKYLCLLQGGDIIEMIGSYSSVERSSAISEHLKIVEVKFPEMDKTTRKVLKFLCTFNIRKLTNDTFYAFYTAKLAFICGKERKE